MQSNFDDDCLSNEETKEFLTAFLEEEQRELEEKAAARVRERREGKTQDNLSPQRVAALVKGSGGKSFSAMLMALQSVEAENEELQKMVTEGRRPVSEYHGQLMLDSIGLTQETTELSEQLERVRAREDELQSRMMFLFDDCKRLVHDNATIVSEATTKEAELKMLQRRIELQDARYRGLRRSVAEAGRSRTDGVTQLERSHEALKNSRKKLLEQHGRLWELQDLVDAYRAERVYLLQLVADREEEEQRVRHNATLPPLAKKLRELRRAPLPPTMENAESSMSSSSAACHREDCIAVRNHIAELEAKLKDQTKERAKLQQLRLQRLQQSQVGEDGAPSISFEDMMTSVHDSTTNALNRSSSPSQLRNRGGDNSSHKVRRRVQSRITL